MILWPYSMLGIDISLSDVTKPDSVSAPSEIHIFIQDARNLADDSQGFQIHSSRNNIGRGNVQELLLLSHLIRHASRSQKLPLIGVWRFCARKYNRPTCWRCEQICPSLGMELCRYTARRCNIVAITSSWCKTGQPGRALKLKMTSAQLMSIQDSSASLSCKELRQESCTRITLMPRNLCRHCAAWEAFPITIGKAALINSSEVLELFFILF